MQLKKIYLAIAGVLVVAANVLAQEKPLPLDPAVRMGKLPNGFTYYIRHNEEPKNRVVFYLANKVGSILETDEQQGLAHFMEHMSFNGTTHFPKNELVNYLQKSGVRFGADLNAYTSFDETVYQLPLPTDKPEILQNGIQIMRDWAQEATLDPVEIDKERGVILEEKRLGKGAQERMRRQYFPMMLNQSRYANRLPIGTEEILKGFKPEVIKDYYHTWYRPDLQALIVVGDIDVNRMEQTIKAKFSDLKNPQGEKARVKYTVPLTGKNQFQAVTDPEMTSLVAQIMIKHKAVELITASEYRAAITSQLFNHMLRARYAELLRQADPPYLKGGAGIEDFLGGLDNFNVSVSVKPQGMEMGIKAVWREVERVKRFGFTATELDRAKKSYLGQMESALKEKNKTSSESYVQEYLKHFLKNEVAPGIDAEFELVKTTLPQITLEDMSKLVQTYIRNDNRDILLMAPEKDKAGLPDEATVTGWLKAVETEDLKPYTDEVSTLALLKKAPVIGKIVKEEKDAHLGITTFTLSNGVKVILRPTDFKNNEIMFSSFSAGGTSLYNDADYQSAANAVIIASFGAGNYNVTELSKYLSGKQVSVQPYIGERSQGVNGGATPKYLEDALQLVYAYFTEPRKDENQFQSIINRAKAGLANRGGDPLTVFKDSLSAIIGNYNIRRTAPTLAKLEQINLDKAYQIYNERFADASGMTFTFVGSIDMGNIRQLLEKYIASLPSTYKMEKAKDLGINPPAGRLEKNIYKGTEAKASVQLYFTGDFNYTTKDKEQLEALKETLEFRLLERLREDEGGVYTPGVYASAGKYPHPRYSFVITFGCDPKNVDKLIASALDEVNKLKTEGPPQVNIDKYKTEYQRSHETSIKTNKWWLIYLNGKLQDKEPLNDMDGYNAEVQAITSQSLKLMAQKYLSGKNFMRFVLLPQSSRETPKMN
ncbi:pitrilysin family protein [Mucilaginibacter sp. UR6-11]|uniref:M16 family metallopeptidase n=1 Tax=Mucilaginibacter sp. UR6-11 TaxID=1435644 RepID=UPI001E53FBB8|nr:M16 family metallopeptidase [Mucilaginibacter sp. UR6-11]MCC8426884.1 insulinase family protein [Mucilaginibacter sp. UR6-11]